jgi:hypothetical protein
MKTIIETNETDLVGLQFEKDGVITDWADLSREEQVKITNTFIAYYNLYSKFIKK